MTSLKLFPVVAEGIVASQAVADFDGDGRPDIVDPGQRRAAARLQADPGAQERFEEPPNRLPITTTRRRHASSAASTRRASSASSRRRSRPTSCSRSSASRRSATSIRTACPTSSSSGGSLSLAGALAGGGTPRRARAAPPRDLERQDGQDAARARRSSIEDYTFLVNHAIADVSGDDYPEVITGTGGYFLHAADGCGREAAGLPEVHERLDRGDGRGRRHRRRRAEGSRSSSARATAGSSPGRRRAARTAPSSGSRSTTTTRTPATTRRSSTRARTQRAPKAARVPYGRGAEPTERFDVGGGCACRTRRRPASPRHGLAACARPRRRRSPALAPATPATFLSYLAAERCGVRRGTSRARRHRRCTCRR